MQVDLTPAEVFPGDAFMIKVTGVASPGTLRVAADTLKIPMNSCGEGCFTGIGVIHLDSAPGDKKISVTDGQIKSMANLRVKKPHFPEIHLKLPESKVALSPEDLARVKEEEKRLGSVWPNISGKLYDGTFMMPVPNRISTGFGVKRIINNKTVSIHRGIDLKGSMGERVMASNRGRVVVTEEFFFGGNTVVIDHGAGIYTIYMHLSGFAVKPGAIVETGEVIGFVGSTGRSTGPHLHLSLKILNITANPLSLIHLSVK